MMIIYKADDGSHFELEELGNGNLRALFRDGITRAEAQTTVLLKDYRTIATVMFQCKQMAEAFRMGTPRSSAPNQTPINNRP